MRGGSAGGGQRTAPSPEVGGDGAVLGCWVVPGASCGWVGRPGSRGSEGGAGSGLVLLDGSLRLLGTGPDVLGSGLTFGLDRLRGVLRRALDGLRGLLSRLLEVLSRLLRRFLGHALCLGDQRSGLLLHR